MCSGGGFYFDQIALSCWGWGGGGPGPGGGGGGGRLTRPVSPQHLQLVRQEMAVCPEQLGEFLGSLRQYLRGTSGARHCFQ